ncbi:DUF7159 family protein [Mycolicibacter hiberniae]|uniref:DUF7159 domain-containing protein n=1 Tax=Mycolicibacter hiberniae TaxID=29314 RepID=A0A7I7XAQ4_9MYCO|nr:hypothetical protein [Mycolicibacter hiberniae]MCV7087357.1 hypothetical protein [Mycolicibacter hiberniae]ORV67677.1 hypothetical protein AWC09_15960 [Mycolicibacter hiberniae]BBZ25428.1 hypothetical protein MHIB_38460 [Mycolicibacter hiberniae]
MDIVLGVSMAPLSVRMVLVEGERAGGVTVDEDGFEVEAGDAALPHQVVSAILGTQESARESGYRLAATGVTVADQLQAGRLRDALAQHRVENVMLVSAFLAAAALAQTVGSSVGYQRTALMFVEPDGATLAVVDSADGSITEVQKVTLPADDAAAKGELTRLAAEAGRLPSQPEGLFVVGSGVNIGVVKPALDAASALPVSVPEEPETALARGAALASAHTPQFDSSTSALAWARDPGTGMIDPELVALAYAYPADYDATMGEFALAYSAVPDDAPSGYLDLGAEGFDGTVLDSNDSYPPSSAIGVVDVDEPLLRRRPFLLASSGLAAFFVVGVSSLAVALAVSIRPTAADHPAPSGHIIAPTQQAPAPAPAPEVAPLPAPEPPAVKVPVAQPVPAPAAPAPAPAAPAVPVPAPAAPAPAPVAPVPVPVPVQVPAPVEVPAPAAPVPAPQIQQPELPPLFRPPAQKPSNNGGNPSWLPDNDGGGKKGGNPSWFPDNDGGKKGGNPSWFPDNDGGGKKGGNPSPWLPGIGTNGGGGNPWIPGLGGGSNARGGGGGSWFPGFGGGGQGGGGKSGGWPF